VGEPSSRSPHFLLNTCCHLMCPGERGQPNRLLLFARHWTGRGVLVLSALPPLLGLLCDPLVDFLATKPPRTPHLECGDLLSRRQAIDRALAHLEVGSYFVEREYLASVVF